MPRKSAASLGVVPLQPPAWPKAPAELTPAQAKIWDEIVRCRPPDYFDGACTALLVAYARCVTTLDLLAEAINQTDPEYKLYGRLLGIRARESALLCSLSTKLRLAPSNTKRIETKVPRPFAGLAPWERHTSGKGKASGKGRLSQWDVVE